MRGEGLKESNLLVHKKKNLRHSKLKAVWTIPQRITIMDNRAPENRQNAGPDRFSSCRTD